MEDKKTYLRLKAKLGTAEMKMCTKLKTCLYTIPKENFDQFQDEITTLDLQGSTDRLLISLRHARAEKTKKNPYYIWNDLQKLKESYEEFIELSDMVLSQCKGSGSYLDRVFERLEQYQTLVEELVQILQKTILHLCKTHESPLPSSFPLKFKPKAKSTSPKQVPPESWPEVLLKADQPQQKVP